MDGRAEVAAAERAIRRLAAARLVSWIGTEAAYIALIALIYERSHGSGVWISTALLAALGARVLVSPWGGALGDYFDRRVVMIGSDVAAAACFVAISQVHSLPFLVALAALAGMAEAPFSPASSALLAMIVPEERRGWASGAVSAGSSTGMLIGAACGGLLVATFGAASAFLINAISFLVSAALVYSIRGHFRVPLAADSDQRGALQGVRLILAQRVLRTSTLSVAIVALALGMTNVAELPLFVSIGAGKIGFGVAVAAWAGGQITGGRLAARIVNWRLERLALIVGCVVLAAVIGLAGALPVFPVVAMLFVAAGIANALVNVSLILMAQRWVPAEVQSRAIAAIEAIANTAVGVSLLVGGLLLSPLGARGVYLLAGALGAVAAALAFRVPRDGAPSRSDPLAGTVADQDRRARVELRGGGASALGTI
jgi:MFS family permease